MPCWSSWKTGIGRRSSSVRVISKHCGAATSSTWIAPKVSAIFSQTLMNSFGSLVSMRIGSAEIFANSQKIADLPSITGMPASGPMSPRPRMAVPSVTMATLLKMPVSSRALAGSASMALHTRATPGV